MPTENRSSNTEQMVGVPMHIIERIRAELRLSPSTWTELEDCVAQAVNPDILPCDVRLPPGTIISRGTTISTLLLAIKQREKYPAHARGFNAQPTSDGFSAGDMADQGAKAFRDEQRAAIPEGFALVPKEMLLSKEVIGVINFHCGDTAEEEGGQFGQYTDGRLWVGNVTDDDGNQVHGLHIMTDEYPEEGSTTLIEFPAAPVNNPA